MSKRFLVFFFVSVFTLPLFAQSVDTAWVRRYNGPGNGPDSACAIAVDNSGSVYVTGRSVGAGTGLDYATIKYYPNGDTAWVRRYNGSGNGDDYACAIIVDSSGNAYVTGYSRGNGTNYDYATIKYYSNGDTAWIRRYNGSMANEWGDAHPIAIDRYSNVYVTGSSLEGALDYATIKYYPNGDTAWVRSYDGTGNSGNWASAIAVDQSGNVYVTGHIRYANGSIQIDDIATVKYDSSGNRLWERIYGGPGNAYDYAYAMTIDSSGNIYVTGFTYVIWWFETSDYLTLKYLPNGDTVWVRRYNGPANLDDCARAIVVDKSGNVLVTGYTNIGANATIYLTVKYYPDGEIAWTRTYFGPGEPNLPKAIAVDDSGNVYVTGESGGSGTGSDYATIKYYSNGDTAWIKRYNGPPLTGEDAASAIAVDITGNVYVTGISVGNGTYQDYATIKYVQFLRGDVDTNGQVSVSDVIYLITYLFKRGPAPLPIVQVGDDNCDGKVNIADAVYLINYLFKGGPPPAC